MSRKIVLAIVAIGMSCMVFADGDLFKVCFGSEESKKGELYYHNPSYGSVVVLQVLKNGVLGKMHKMFSSSEFVEERIIFVSMDTSGVSDGKVLPRGLYCCVGTISYETAMGAAKTVPAFAKLSSEEEREIYQKREEAAKRLEKELRESAIREQPERKKIAGDIIGNVDLNMGCIRIEKSIAPSFEIKVKNFMWKKLEESKASGDYIAFLNAADDIVNDRSDFTARFDLIPDKKTIQDLCNALKKHRFKCDFYCDKELVFLVPNANWKKFIDSCKRGTIDVGHGIRRVLYRISDGSSKEFGPAAVLSYAQEEYGLAVLGDQLIVIGAKGSAENLRRGELEKKAKSLCKKIENQEMSLSEFKSEMLEMDNEAWRKINAELIPIPRGAELERIRADAARQKSSELVKAKEEFVKRMAEISFCLGDHIIVQQDLLPYVHSVKVDEGLLRLQRLQQEQSWDELAKLLTSAAEINTPDVYSKAWAALAERQFPVDIYFTKNTRYYQRKSEGDWWSHSFADSGIIDMKISVVEKTKMCVYASVNYGDPLRSKISNPAFDIMSWLKTQKFDKMRPDIRNMELATIPRQGPRDISQLVKHKDDELNAAKADLSRFRRAVASVKWPPEYLVVTNVSVVGGKMVYGETKKSFKIPQKVRGLALLLDNKDVAELYGKYCGRLDLGRFKEEWKKAGDGQEGVYKKYKSAFEGIEASILKALESANSRACSGLGQPMSLEDIANRQSNYSMPINQEQPRSSVGKTAKHVCDNCRGRKYVQTEVECPKCGGAGTTYTPPKKLIQGYSKPRTSQCSNCSGRGTVRKSVPCPNCNR